MTPPTTRHQQRKGSPMSNYTPANPYTYECPALDRLAQLAGATGDPDEGYPDGGEAVGLGAVDLDGRAQL